MRNVIFNSLAAGFLISIGGSVFLGCEDKAVGAVLFTVALLTICKMKLYLFTGKIGFIAESFKKEDSLHLITGLLGNYVAATLFGLMIKYAIPTSSEKALAICEKKLTQAPLQTFILGIFCGALMYIAIKIYKDNSLVGILFGVPVFILAGFEHSIADMFYFAAGGLFSAKYVLFLVLVVLGNTVGGVILPVFKRLAGADK